MPCLDVITDAPYSGFMIDQPTYRICPKCNTLDTLVTVCSPCLNALRDQHNEQFDIWDIDAEDIGAFDRWNLLELYCDGWTIEKLMAEFNLSESTVRWVLKTAKVKGELSVKYGKRILHKG